MQGIVKSIVALWLLVTFCCGFMPLPKVDKLPNSSHPLWNEFSKCKFVRDEVKNLTLIGFTVDVRRLNNKEIEISGFMVPLESGKKIKHFLLNRINPTCAFCPPGRPSEIIEVFAKEGVEWHENLAKFSGRLELVNDGRQRIFFLLKNAVKR